MDIDTIQAISAIITLTSVIILYIAILNNKKLNKNILLNEIVKQERELRMKLSEYREEIHRRLDKNKKQEDYIEITFDYDTLLFNYYEYVSICIYKKLIEESDAKLYFNTLLASVRDKFEYSLLFEEGLAKREEYPGIRWLFKKWKISS